MLGAHYDAYSNLYPGANDNASSCVILLNLIDKLKDSNLSIDFVFFDKEEMDINRQFAQGSKEYINIIGKDNIKGMINLDMCGMGSNIVIHPEDFNKNVLSEYPFKGIIKDCKNILSRDPGGDNYSFSLNNIPNIMLFNSSDNDLVWYNNFDKGIYSYNADFLNTMHTENDTIDTFDESGMEMIYNYLYNHLKDK